MSSIRGREPVLMTTFSPRRVRVPPPWRATSIVFGATKAPLAHDEFRPARPVLVEVHLDQPVHHLPLAVAHGGHVDPPAVLAMPNSSLRRK